MTSSGTHAVGASRLAPAGAGGTPEGRQRRRWRQASLKNATSKIAIAAHQEARRKWPTIAEAVEDAIRRTEAREAAAREGRLHALG